MKQGAIWKGKVDWKKDNDAHWLYTTHCKLVSDWHLVLLSLASGIAKFSTDANVKFSTSWFEKGLQCGIML
jgi:hypothetical protein